jgi:hypothetical protein
MQSLVAITQLEMMSGNTASQSHLLLSCHTFAEQILVYMHINRWDHSGRLTWGHVSERGRWRATELKELVEDLYADEVHVKSFKKMSYENRKY